MKKGIILLLAALLTGSAAFAQETPAKFKLYGFIRNYMTADTRAVNAGTEDLYYYMPKGHDYKNATTADSKFDANEGFNWRFVSLTTRLGLDVSGYKFGTMGVSGKVEADFYNLSGSVPILRLRQAFMKLAWDESPVSLTLGQTWHPMAADMPHMNNLETGAPFNPFNRSPQVTLDYKAGDFTFTASLLYLNHYLPTGPAGKTKDYYKYGLPELYAGVTYKSGKFTGKLGLDMVNMRPYRTVKATWVNSPDAVSKVKGMLTTFSPFVFLQYTDGMFQLRAKSILAQAGEHMNLLSGYGISNFDWTKGVVIEYTPMQDWASFVSFSYGKKVQAMCMLGYMKQLGTTKDLFTGYVPEEGNLWMNTAADVHIQQAFRATPTVAWNIGKFTLSLEYNLTAAEFGSGTRNARGMYTGEKEWILNHRFICMTKFNF